MAIDNRNRTKNPALAEIEGEDNGQVNAPIENVDEDTFIPKADTDEVLPETPSLETLLAKDPEQLSAADLDALSQYKEDLTTEQKVKYGLADEEVLDNKPTKVVTPPVAPPKDNSTEEQLAQQRREAQIISAQNRKITETIDQASNIPDPTEEELKMSAYQDGINWSDLSELEKKLFKKNYINDKRFAMVHQVTKDIQLIDEWANKVDKFIEEQDNKQEYVGLGGHEGDFRRFAMMESHRGVDMDVLINAFLNKLPVGQKKKGSLFPIGGGQAPEKPKSDSIMDAEEAASLRIRDHREYARLVKSGKIKIEID